MQEKDTDKNTRQPYTPPAIDQIRIDNQISVVLMSEQNGNDDNEFPPGDFP